MRALKRGALVKSVYTWALLIFLTLIIVPSLVALLYTSFRTDTPGSTGGSFTLANWIELVEHRTLAAIGNTLFIAAITSIIAVPVGFFFAWVEIQTDTPLVRALGSFFIIPLVFSPLLTTIAWTVLASPRAGVINVIVRHVFGIETFFDLYSMHGIIWVSVLYFIPIAYLTVRGPLRNIDSSTLEAARASGASALTAIRRVLIPLMMPGLGAAFLLTFTLNAGLFSVVTLLGISSGTRTMQLDIYLSMVEDPTDPTHAATMAMVLLVISVVNFLLYRRVVGDSSRYTTLTGKGFRVNRLELGGWRFATCGLVILYLLVSVALPYLALVYAALVPFLSANMRFDELGFENFRMFWESATMMRGLQNTAKLVFIGGTASAAIAFSVGYLIRRSRDFAAKALETISFLPLALPTLSYALGLLWFVLSFELGRQYLYGTLLIIYLAQLTSFLPLGVQIVATGVVQLGNEMEDAAKISGARAPARMRRIVLPLLKPTIASAWIVLSIHAGVEAGLTIFLFTGQTVTTSVNVFNNAFFGYPNLVYAGALILATFGLVSIGLSNWFSGVGKHLRRSTAED